MSTQTYDRGTGRRKCAIAQVKLFPGKGEIIVNGKPYQERFTRTEHRHAIDMPFKATNTVGKYNVEIKVTGGGISGQAGAIRHGISRALVKFDATLRPVLRRGGFLTRDPRMKERKKFGRKGARRGFQFTKR